MRGALLGLLLLGAACDRMLPFGDADGQLHDAAPGGERSVGEGPIRDGPAADGPGVTISFLPPASTEIAVGRYQLLTVKLTVHGLAPSLSFAAPPCLLRQKGSGAVPAKALAVTPAPGSSSLDLVVFAPPDALPGSTCKLSLTPSVPVEPPAFTVKAPIYGILDLGDHTISAIEGLKVRTLGALSNASEQLQAIAWAGGSFGGAWFAALGKATDNPVTPSTVQIYRFGAQQNGAIPTWLSLVGKSLEPTQVEDLVWSPEGPCGDSLYLGAAGGPPAGVYCLDPAAGLKTFTTDRARTLDVAPVAGFAPASAKGALLVSRWGGYRLYPGGELSFPTTPGITSNSADELRFARLGPHAGSLYVVGSLDPQELFRVSPDPHQVLVLDQLLPADKVYGTPTFSFKGPFGQQVLIPREDPAQYRLFDLVAFFEESGKVRQLPLLKSLRCAQHVAFDDGGTQLVAITGSLAGSPCWGTRTAHLFEFDIP